MLLRFPFLRFGDKRYRQCLPRVLLARTQCKVHSYRSTAVTFAELFSKPTSKIQIYSSLSYNPFFNLSVEHYLLQKTPEDSTILLFYVNKPCVVIGRNQNPWLEANLNYMATNPVNVSDATLNDDYPIKHYVELVRRRSGGGTVFHDFQNINYCVIRPSSVFTRDRSVEMVVKAIRKDNPRVRVNERHDIVLDTGPLIQEKDYPKPSDMHRTRFAPSGTKDGKSLKVSGSAYKLTRNRSLHHGTCLLNSPNLHEISKYLHSPARPFMNAKGVDSVRSPVSNLHEASSRANYRLRFETQVSDAFRTELLCKDGPTSRPEEEDDWVEATFDESLAEIPEIRAGMEELTVICLSDWRVSTC